MRIKSLNEAMEILQHDTPISRVKKAIGEDISIDNVLEHSGEYIKNTELADYLSKCFEEIGFTKAEVMKRAGISDVLGFQVFSGVATPTFNTLIRICIGGTLNLAETQTAIELAGYTPLVSSNRRDEILINGIMYMKSINAINDSLYSEHLTLL